MQDLQRRNAEATAPRPTPGPGETSAPAPPAAAATQAEESVLQPYCKEKWPDNYEMQSFCIDQQRDAVKALSRRNASTESVPPDVFTRVRTYCVSKWPRNYEMRDFCEGQQLEAYHKLQGESQ